MEELKLIHGNLYGQLATEQTAELTHSEVISFARSFVSAIESGMINPFSGWSIKNQSRVMFFINFIRTPGIPHRDRSRAAKRCLEIIEQQRQEGKTGGYPGDKDWEDIPW